MIQRTLSSAWPSCSFVYWKVRDAKGVIWDPKLLLPASVVDEVELQYLRNTSYLGAERALGGGPLTRYPCRSLRNP